MLGWTQAYLTTAIFTGAVVLARYTVASAIEWRNRRDGSTRTEVERESVREVVMVGDGMTFSWLGCASWRSRSFSGPLNPAGKRGSTDCPLPKRVT